MTLLSGNQFIANRRLASLFTALQEQMGLRLEGGKGPVKVVVFDAIALPGEN